MWLQHVADFQAALGSQNDPPASFVFRSVDRSKSTYLAHDADANEVMIRHRMRPYLIIWLDSLIVFLHVTPGLPSFVPVFASGTTWIPPL